MNTNASIPTPQDANKAVDTTADRAQGAIRSTQNVANDAFDKMSNKVDNLHDQAMPLIDRWSDKARDTASRGADVVKDKSAKLKQQAAVAQDNTVGYIREEPMKSMLMAAATGAVLMAVFTLVIRSGRD